MNIYILRTASLFVSIAFFCGCARDAANPFALTPENPYSTWTPMKGNALVSSRYCKTLLPNTFGEGEMNLAELIDIALQNNPSTKQTWANARAAAAQYGQSMSSFYPQINVSNQYVRQKGSFPTSQAFTASSGSTQGSGSAAALGNTVATNTLTTQTFYSTQGGPDVSLSYVLFDFGQRTAATMAAREALYYADLNHNQEIQTILQTVMDDYYTYIYQIAALHADEANLANAQMSLDAANEKFALGLVALGDVATARTQFLQSRINLTSQKQAVENAFAQLAVDIGLPANIRFKVQPLPDQVVADPILADVNALVQIAQTQRQDLLAAQANVRSKEALLLRAKRAILPVLSTTLDTGHYWFQKGTQEKRMHWIASLSLDFPIFDGFYFKNGVRNAEANLDVSKAELYQTELTMIQNVTTAHMGVQTAALNLSDSNEYLLAAELEFNIALANYKAGTKTILDVLSAQSSLADARSKKAQAQQNWFSSLASIAYATGSLCATPNEEATCINTSF